MANFTRAKVTLLELSNQASHKMASEDVDLQIIRIEMTKQQIVVPTKDNFL